MTRSAMAKRDSRRRRERGLAGLLAALLCLLWPFASWHELTTPHEVCAEHGERLDVAHEGRQVPHPEEARVTEPVEGDVHEECPYAPLAQPADGEPLLARFEGAPRTCGRWEALVEAPRAGAIPGYLLAPKQSPPIRRVS